MGREPKDKSGLRFGRLLVIEKSIYKRGTHSMYLCKCDCGVESYIDDARLLPHLDASCGCKLREIKQKRKEKAGYWIAKNKQRKTQDDK